MLLWASNYHRLNNNTIRYQIRILPVAFFKICQIHYLILMYNFIKIIHMVAVEAEVAFEDNIRHLADKTSSEDIRYYKTVPLENCLRDNLELKI